MAITPSLLVFSTFMLIPVSDQVPTFDVAPSCKAASAINFSGSQPYEACMGDEETARKQLVGSWSSYPASERGRCTEEASMGGSASYVELLVCLQMARDVNAAGNIRLKGARKKY